MVCRLRALFNPTKRLSEDGKDLTRVCIIDHESGIVVYVRQACQTTRIRHKLPHQVSLSLSSRRTHTTDYLDGQASPRHLSLWPRRPSLNFSPSSYPEVAPHPSLSVTPPRIQPQSPPDLPSPLCIDTQSSTTAPAVDHSNPDSHGSPIMVSARDPNARRGWTGPRRRRARLS